MPSSCVVPPSHSGILEPTSSPLNWDKVVSLQPGVGQEKNLTFPYTLTRLKLPLDAL